MEQYAAEQLALFATNNPLYYYEGENKIHIKIESRKILDDPLARRRRPSLARYRLSCVWRVGGKTKNRRSGDVPII
eukprot:scaffold15682_cov131-Isochrysis_galbana.AAC.2